MQLELLALVVIILSSMGHSSDSNLKLAKERRQRRKCKIENCEECFSRNFCTKCKEGLYSHRGRCYTSCPDGFSTANGTMECAVQCELGEWSAWGPCMKKNKTCGFKKGSQTRLREPVQALSSFSTSGPPAQSTCSPESETQRCAVPRRVPCVRGGGKKKNERHEGQRNHEKSGGKNRGREAKEKSRGRAGGGRRKKSRATAAPVTTLSPISGT
ncbi:R-spondin-1 isoform X2 [Denticeps clupeoides]|uniref:R-spondin-1 isoform X2 n=1 Tax=Denticeps clupeoides TaxID=299321 RepID=UPI0010A353EB|nr:R-spondin-1 isoform X2 [Denticeps clupeoides]